MEAKEFLNQLQSLSDFRAELVILSEKLKKEPFTRMFAVRPRLQSVSYLLKAATDILQDGQEVMSLRFKKRDIGVNADTSKRKKDRNMYYIP